MLILFLYYIIFVTDTHYLAPFLTCFFSLFPPFFFSFLFIIFISCLCLSLSILYPVQAAKSEEDAPPPQSPSSLGMVVSDEVYHKVGAANDVIIVKGKDGKLSITDFNVRREGGGGEEAPRGGFPWGRFE